MKFFLKIILFAFIACTFTLCHKEAKVTAELEPPVPRVVHIDPLVQNLRLPWGLAYLPDGGLLFTEREGNINLMKKGETVFKTLLKRQVNTASEGGLLALAIDPAFAINHLIYIYETIGNSHNRVVQLSLENEALTEVKIILDNIPFNTSHNGGCIKFGPDGYLYVGTGDAQQPSQAQDRMALGGKILRIDRDGNVPPGNPFNNFVWSYGHRNVQGFSWTGAGQMLATEHGPSGEFGWCCHDEINLIQPGKNYGWPLAYNGMEKDSLTPSLINSGEDTWAPSGCTWLGSSAIWPNCLAVACLRGERIIRFYLNSQANGVVFTSDTLKGQFNRLRNITEAPDGSLIFCSSNIGTTGAELPNDDKLYRLSRK